MCGIFQLSLSPDPVTLLSVGAYSILFLSRWEDELWNTWTMEYYSAMERMNCDGTVGTSTCTHWSRQRERAEACHLQPDICRRGLGKPHKHTWSLGPGRENWIENRGHLRQRKCDSTKVPAWVSLHISVNPPHVGQPKVNPNINCGIWVVFVWQCGFVNLILWCGCW